MALMGPVMCCFCGLSLPEPEAVQIGVWPTPERDESQSFYSHRICLLNRLHPEVPVHPALEDESGQRTATALQSRVDREDRGTRPTAESRSGNQPVFVAIGIGNVMEVRGITAPNNALSRLKYPRWRQRRSIQYTSGTV